MKLLLRHNGLRMPGLDITVGIGQIPPKGAKLFVRTSERDYYLRVLDVEYMARPTPSWSEGSDGTISMDQEIFVDVEYET